MLPAAADVDGVESKLERVEETNAVTDMERNLAMGTEPRYEEARNLCAFMERQGYPTRLAGGCVRDLLLGFPAKDIDLATTAEPEVARKILVAQGYRVLSTGLKHGTQTIVTPIQTIEITTLRSDLECDGRHAKVAFSIEFEEDAKRRDFTINALYQDYRCQIFDYVGGQEDLKNRVLRFVGNPEARIREDYLRILRYFRFLSRLGWSPLESQLDAVKRMREGISHLSGERIKWELDLIFSAPHAPEILQLIQNAGVLNVLFPWFSDRKMSHISESFVFLLGGSTRTHEYLRLFSLFYFGNTAEPSMEDLVRQMDVLPFRRKEKQVVQRLFRLVHARSDAISMITEVLSLCERGEVDAALLDSFLGHLSISAKMTRDPLLSALLRGISRCCTSPPKIPKLRDIPRKTRGPVSRILKALYYLNIWSDPEQSTQLMQNPQLYFKRISDEFPDDVVQLLKHFDPLISVLRKTGDDHAEHKENT